MSELHSCLNVTAQIPMSMGFAALTNQPEVISTLASSALLLSQTGGHAVCWDIRHM